MNEPGQMDRNFGMKNNYYSEGMPVVAAAQLGATIEELIQTAINTSLPKYSFFALGKPIAYQENQEIRVNIIDNYFSPLI